MELTPSLVPILEKALLFFCSGAFWSMVGFSLAFVSMSKYVAYCSPFVVYYILIILTEGYFPSLFCLYPKEWLNPTSPWLLGCFGVVLLLAELFAILVLVYTICARRRLGDG